MQKNTGIPLSLLLWRWSNMCEKLHTRCKHPQNMTEGNANAPNFSLPPFLLFYGISRHLCLCDSFVQWASQRWHKAGTGKAVLTDSLLCQQINKLQISCWTMRCLKENRQPACLPYLWTMPSSSIWSSHTSWVYNSKALSEVSEASLDQKNHPDNNSIRS